MTAPATIRQADVARLIKGAVKAGLPRESIRLTVQPDGALSLTTEAVAANDDHGPTGWEDA
jgi:hypothetical protein